MNSIMVDTSVWIEYFKNNEDIASIIDNLLDKNQICITGPVVSELLQGIKTEKELKLLNMYIDGIPYVPCSIDDWKDAGSFLYDLRRKGITIPLTDMIIAVVSIRHGMKIFTFDNHFEKIPGVELFLKD